MRLFFSIMTTAMLSLVGQLALMGSAIADSEQIKTHCPSDGPWLQVLGSGGPELGDGRASTSYLIWLDGKARILVDTGAGSHQNFEKSGANFNDLDAIVFSHLHVDHSNDLPAFIKSSFFTGRKNDLAILGPDGNHLLPAMDVFLQRLFGKQGAWPYLSSHLNPESSDYQLLATAFPTANSSVESIFKSPYVTISAVGVNHGALPAVAWRIDFANTKKSIVFSGDMSGNRHTLEKLALNADMLVAHNAIPETAQGVARRLHMPPSVIGNIAAKSKVKNLVLSHRMQRTNNTKADTQKWVKKQYSGTMNFADDMACFKI